jgi:DNA polymerase-3 subunit gamma/tau
MITYYRKYRPQKVEELDIEDVRESLGRIVKSGKIPQAFLFSGPKGTGKTSAARIIAKIVNCQGRGNKPCNKCEQCTLINKGSNIDVIELDAASHRGIEDVRSLRDAVKLAPAKADKKVYVIDEVHMLTVEASNALLKTLEEPPEHVIFILATTNPEKLIETIRSRTTNIVFRRATLEETVRSLKRVVKGEKIKINDKALELIAKSANGSFRDAVKTLEQMVTEKRSLKDEAVGEYLFKTKAINLEELVGLLVRRDTKAALEEVERIAVRGVSMMSLVEQLLEIFRSGLLAKVGIGKEDVKELSKKELIELIKLFSEAGSQLKDAIIEQLPIEIAVVEWCQANVEEPRASSADKDQDPIREEPARGSSSSASLAPADPDKAKVVQKVPISKIKQVTEEVWRTILAQVKPINTSIEALLRAARPLGFDGNTLTLGVYYRFHKERLEDGHHRRILEEVVAQVMGVPVRVFCTLTEPPTKAEPKPVEEKPVLTEGEDEDIIKIAEEIFGN